MCWHTSSAIEYIFVVAPGTPRSGSRSGEQKRDKSIIRDAIAIVCATSVRVVVPRAWTPRRSILPSRRRGRRPCRSPPFAVVWRRLSFPVDHNDSCSGPRRPQSAALYTWITVLGVHDQSRHSLLTSDLSRANDSCLNKCDACVWMGNNCSCAVTVNYYFRAIGMAMLCLHANIYRSAIFAARSYNIRLAYLYVAGINVLRSLERDWWILKYYRTVCTIIHVNDRAVIYIEK